MYVYRRWWSMVMHKSFTIIKATKSGEDEKKSSLHFFLIHFCFSSFSYQTESDRRHPRKIVARAGTNVTLACPGALAEKSVLKIEKLTWKSSQTIIKFINGRPLEQNQRVSVIQLGMWKCRVSLYLLTPNLLYYFFCLSTLFSEITESEKFQLTFQSGEANR